MSKKSLTYVETEGGPFICLPLELKASWTGVGDEDDDDDDEEDDDDDDDDDDDEDDGDDDDADAAGDADADDDDPDAAEAGSDYDRAVKFLSSVGVLDVGKGSALILGTAEITAFLPTDAGGVFIQQIGNGDDDEVIAAVEQALASGQWKKTPHTFNVGKGKLALFDSACAYEDADEDNILPIKLTPGKYAVELGATKQSDFELGLVRLRRL